jgi:hypothetical protein
VDITLVRQLDKICLLQKVLSLAGNLNAFWFNYASLFCEGYAMAQFIEPLRYKPEGRGFDS